jgi:Fe-S oxidoreductase
MSALQITAIALCFTIPLLGWALLVRQSIRFMRLFQTGQTDTSRTDQPATRVMTVLREFLGHTRMARLPIVAIAHWFTAIGFFLLFTTLVNAFFQLIWAEFRLPVLGHFAPFEWLIEVFAGIGFLAICLLIINRQRLHPRSAAGRKGRRSRFYGSVWWQAYYVEFTIFVVMLCIMLLRTLEARLVQITDPGESLVTHFPLSGWGAQWLWQWADLETVKQSIYLVAAVKILVSFAWMITISLTPTMGVAWHRFLAFFNIYFKRNADGRTALGALKPMMVDGKPIDLEQVEDLDEDTALGVGKIEDFTWKNLLDFTSCTECGRCQSQCPAWNTDKPLSPKLVIMTLRDHAHAKAPWLTAAEADRPDLPAHTLKLADSPLIGPTDHDPDRPLSAYDALGTDGVLDPDVLWSCTTCGACVEQCPVDIEHVDAIVDMRRYQNLIASAFPSELGVLFKNLEKNSNPWGLAPRMRMDWAKTLPFEVPVVGGDIEDLSEVDYLFWVGCAGAFEDRAKRTSRAVAELLHTAGVTYAVLGDGEACTGDSARRAGNEFLFQMLAQQNVETLNEVGAKKIVVTCAHCYNTLKNEYPQVGGTYEVVHHTQLLSQLVRSGKLVPVSRPGESAGSKDASTAPTVTYHDPCYLGRHNHVYAPPRELLGALPGVSFTEMDRHAERSFCCGAGGARMWVEEKLGTRININRATEAVGTGAARIAVGCPFCKVMLSDGVNKLVEEKKIAEDDVAVVDIAQMLLAAVRRGGDGA